MNNLSNKFTQNDMKLHYQKYMLACRFSVLFCLYKLFDHREWILIFHKTTIEYNSWSMIISFSIHMWYLIGIYDGLWIQEIHSEPATFLLIKGIFEISRCHIQHYWYPSNDAWHVQMHLLILISCPNGVINKYFLSSIDKLKLVIYYYI